MAINYANMDEDIASSSDALRALMSPSKYLLCFTKKIVAYPNSKVVFNGCLIRHPCTNQEVGPNIRIHAI